MKTGEMFGSLVKYKEQSYYDAHPILYLLTPSQSYKVELYAGYITASDADVYAPEYTENNNEAFLRYAAERSTFPEQSAIYRRLWEQISAKFADYGELLLFESCNEVLNAQKSWSNPQAESYAVMNDLYQIFVDTVRAGGGYNTTRNLILNPYAATTEVNLNLAGLLYDSLTVIGDGYMPQLSLAVKSRKKRAMSTIHVSSSITIIPPEPIIDCNLSNES